MRKANEIINDMAKYIKIHDKDRVWCNVENCKYEERGCTIQCIIDYFRR